MDIVTLHNFQNVTDTDIPLVNQIKTLIRNGNMTQAAVLMEENKTILGNKTVGASFFNELSIAIVTLEKLGKSKKQAIYFEETEPDLISHGNIWFKTQPTTP